MVSLCAAVGCSIKRVASSKFGLFRLPSAVARDERSKKPPIDRRKLWLARINQKNLTGNQLAVKRTPC